MRLSLVMAGLDPAVHVFLFIGAKNADARDKHGHDGETDSERQPARHLHGLESLTSNLPIAPEITKSL
jgi:hypothetical protein